jgi:hypothetical protein
MYLEEISLDLEEEKGDAVVLLRIISVQMLGIDEELCACFTD